MGTETIMPESSLKPVAISIHAVRRWRRARVKLQITALSRRVATGPIRFVALVRQRHELQPSNVMQLPV